MISLQSLIEQILNQLDNLDKENMIVLKRQFAKQHHLAEVPSNTQIIQQYYRYLAKNNLTPDDRFLSLMKKRGIRSQSGIVSVQVLTKPFYCPGKCIFCPNDPVMPKSYIKTEPGAMRAYLNNFDPRKQVYNRLLSLQLNGHKVDKIEMIILGGTWDVYPEAYKRMFVKGLYDACNTFQQFFGKVRFAGDVKDPNKTYTKFNENTQAQKDLGITDAERVKYLLEVENIDEIVYPTTLSQSIMINETAPNRIIGLTIETRPEYITDANCRFRRELGVTRLEVGLQSTDDEVLRMNKRGHTYAQMQQGIHILRQYGFKFSVHMMPGLYGSTMEKDIQSFYDIYSDPYLKPDELKLYPTSVIPNTELYDLYVQGEYQPLTTEQIKHIVSKVLWEIIPPYTRIKRLIRDIPATEIASGSNVTNLYQLLQREWKDLVKRGEKKPEELYKRLISSSIQGLGQDKQGSDSSILTTIWGGEMDIVSSRNFLSLDTRSREIRHKSKDEKWTHGQGKELIVIRQYQSSVGCEYFVSIEDELGYLYGFIRLLLPDNKYIVDRDGLGTGTAMVRELHVYGTVESLESGRKQNRSGIWGKVNKLFSLGKKKKQVQHTGIGRKLMSQAEKIAKDQSYRRLSVISGIGVRKYYEKLGYELEGTYMIKEL